MLLAMSSVKRRIVAGGVLILLAAATHVLSRDLMREKTFVVEVEGYHHLPDGQAVVEYHLNSTVGGRPSLSGDGGGGYCCIMVPVQWREGLVADVRWVVRDYGPGPLDESNFTLERARQGKVIGRYRAKVPIERYEELGRVYIHFFSEGRVRIVPSWFGPGSEASPVRRGDPSASRNATQGIEVKELYTKDEMEALSRKRDEERRRMGGWR